MYKSALKSRIVHQKKYIHEEVHFFQEDLFEFSFLEQPSDFRSTSNLKVIQRTTDATTVKYHVASM